MNRIFSLTFVLAATGLLVASVLTAQQDVQRLSDLIGERASSGESALEYRGYEFAHTHEAGASSYSYWVKTQTGRCISVRTEDGRFTAIVHTPESDCEVEESKPTEPEKKAKETAPESFVPGEEDFNTVCGVEEKGGKTHRFECRLRNKNCASGGACRTHLTMPDNKLTITWHKDGEIDVKAPGVAAEKSKVSAQDGQTRFDFGGKTYFVYRSSDWAKRELAKLDK